MTTFFKRLGGHVGKFFLTQQDGNLTSAAGIATAVLMYLGAINGIPITPDAGAAIVAGVVAIFAAGKKAID